MRSDELDKILDDALSSYSQEEPRRGLENRVLNRIRATRERSRFAWLHWMIPIPAFACVLILAVTILTKRDSVQRPSPAPIMAKRAAASLIAPEAVQTIPTRRRPKHLRLRKREQFPSPTPLTREERSLLAFVARSLKQAEEVLADAKRRSAEPLGIEEIHIEPLRRGGE
jgi:hypothetical protein